MIICHVGLWTCLPVLNFSNCHMRVRVCNSLHIGEETHSYPCSTQQGVLQDVLGPSRHISGLESLHGVSKFCWKLWWSHVVCKRCLYVLPSRGWSGISNPGVAVLGVAVRRKKSSLRVVEVEVDFQLVCLCSLTNLFSVFA